MYIIKVDYLAIQHLKRKYTKNIEESYYTINNLDGEIWKKLIFDYNDKFICSERYIISNYGRVKNTETDKLLKPFRNKKGYLHITIFDPINKEITRLAHRLVGFTFIPNPDNLPQINHKKLGYDFRDFNYVDNLEWTTNIENHRHAYSISNRSLFTINEVMKIKELIQSKNKWSVNSILTELGYNRIDNPDKYDALLNILHDNAYSDIFENIDFKETRIINRNHFTNDELEIIREEIQKDGWSINSILKLLGYNRFDNIDKFNMLNNIVKRASRNDLFSNIKFGKRVVDKFTISNDDIHKICKYLCDGYEIKKIAKLFSIHKDTVARIKYKYLHRNISDLYFDYIDSNFIVKNT